MLINRQLLIPIDDNPVCYQALVYCAFLFADQPNYTFQLLHCSQHSASSILPEPLDNRSSLLPCSSTDQSQQKHFQNLLTKGANVLQQHGAAASNITSAHVASSHLIARSIADHADHHLSDCIVVSRRGIGYLGEMILGSVSAALFRSLPKTPLWVIDGEVKSKDILVAVDGSVHTLRAIDHLAYMFQNRTDISIYLYHCALFLAPKVSCSLDSFHQEWDHDWCDLHLSGDGCLFNGPRQLLLEAGIPSDRIIILSETRHLEESSSIVNQARKHGCGTILLGRRGPKVRKGFFGGVSNRTIRQTQDMAVWIVG